MLKIVHLRNILRFLLLAFCVCFFLTACSGEDVTPQDKTPLGSAEGTTAEEIASNQSDCWQSSLLKEIYDQSGKISLSLYSQITDGAMTLMLTGFAVWMALRLIKHLGAFQEDNMQETWNEIFKQLFMCFVCGLIAGSATNVIWILNHVIFPIYYAFLEFGAEVLNTAVAGDDAQKAFWFLGQQTEFSQNIRCAAGELNLSDTAAAFPDAPQQLMSCLACSINERLGMGMSQILDALWDRGFMAFFIGLFIYIVIWFVKIAFIFYLVDNLFRFTIMVALLPILIMGFAFNVTRGWMKKGFYTIINSAAYMMMIAFVISVCLLALQSFTQLDAAGLNGSHPDDYEASFKEFSVVLLCLVLMIFMVASTMKIVRELTDSLVGGSGSENFQKEGAKLAASIGKFVFLWTGKKIGRQLLKITPIRKGYEKFQKTRNKIIDKVNSLAGRNKE